MKKISIIVPVYNVEEYIKKCIDSIVEQTYANIEIILVNDGSTDNSGNICDEYSKIHNNIKVIHKENGGQSSARNVGLSSVTGEFIGFVDSDDWILPDMYENLYKNIEEFDCDISMCQRINIRKVDEESKAINSKDIKVYNKDEIIKTYLNKDMLAVWNKIYKKDLFENIYFPEGKIHEEIFMQYELLKKSTRFIISDAQKYCYRLSDSSTTRSPLNIKDFNMINEWKKVIEDIEVNYPHLKDDAYIRLYISYFNLINKYVMFGSKDNSSDIEIQGLLYEWINILKENKKVIKKSKYVGMKRQLQIAIVCTSYRIFKFSKKNFNNIRFR